MYGSIDGKWSFIIPFALRGCRDHFNYVGGGSFKEHCLLLQLESLADCVFMNGVASVTALDVLVFPTSIVLDLLGDFDEGRHLLRLEIVVGVVAA